MKSLVTETPLEGIAALDFSVVRELRKRDGITLEEVSRRSGVSISVLSKLERNQNTAELETLYRVARVFGLTASDLLGLAERPSAHRARGRRYRSGPFQFEKVAFKEIACFRARARAGDRLERPEAHGDEFEICWVLSGRLRVTFDRERHELSANQALHFDAALQHSYEALENAEIVIVHLAKPHRF